MSSVIIALAVLGFLASVIALLMFVHKRDQKRESSKVRRER